MRLPSMTFLGRAGSLVRGMSVSAPAFVRPFSTSSSSFSSRANSHGNFRSTSATTAPFVLFAFASTSIASAAENEKGPDPVSEVPTPLPMDKLTCPRRDPPNSSVPSTSQVVLLGCGSYNPPTSMHLRMFEIGKDALQQAGSQVVGAYMSPVNDLYGKKGLLPSVDRIAMCARAAETSPMIMVDEWEARQTEYVRTLAVLHRMDRALNYGELARDEVSAGGRTTTTTNGDTRLGVALLCGADMLASFLIPGVWHEDDMHEILGTYQVVCIYRDGTDLEALLNQRDSILNQYKDRIIMVRDPFVNNISSTLVRQCLKEGRSVRYVVPDGVISYIQERGLYEVTKV